MAKQKFIPVEVDGADGWQTRIEAIRKERGLSQRKLAKLAGLGPTSVRKMVSGKGTITLDSARRLAHALNAPLNYILVGQGCRVDDTSGKRRHIRILEVLGPTDVIGKPPAKDLGYVAIDAKSYPHGTFALRISDESMNGTGMNELIPVENILLPGDVVLFSTECDVTPGHLVIAPIRVQQGRGVCLSARRLEIDDEGFVSAPQGPGLGVDIDWESIRENEVARI